MSTGAETMSRGRFLRLALPTAALGTLLATGVLAGAEIAALVEGEEGVKEKVEPAARAAETTITMPPKQYCGESMEEYFRLLVFQDIFSRFATPQNIDTIEENSLFEGIEQVAQRDYEITQNWKKSNCYFYEEGGSPYDDYKRVRKSHFPDYGSMDRWIFETFRLDMTTGEALTIIEELVAGWWQ